MAERMVHKRDTPAKRAIIATLTDTDSGSLLEEPFAVLRDRIQKKSGSVIDSSTLRNTLSNFRREGLIRVLNIEVEDGVAQGPSDNIPGIDLVRSASTISTNADQRAALQRIIREWDHIARTKSATTSHSLSS